ncbi:MAG TPA: response regulator [Gemmatimonadaceae bacterium]|nr:response regulator [Gemmatimonadaceae bacterium]
MARILIVDDSGYARRVHRGILESQGHRILESSTGLSAIETYALERPDLVLLDLSMEDIGGVDVLRRLREIDAGARVIVISADVQRTTEQSVMEAGARRFLGKPVDPEKLISEIGALLQPEQSVEGKPS